MQQRQLRLGDVLDDYCPRERRVTNHVIVAMIEADVRLTRCSTCDAEHDYKHARVPRQRRKEETPALYAHVLASAAPKIVTHAHAAAPEAEPVHDEPAFVPVAPQVVEVVAAVVEPADSVEDFDEPDLAVEEDDEVNGNVPAEGPMHRRLIRATLPRPEGHQPAARPAPEFTIRQPATGRPNRFRARPGGGGGGGGRPGGSAGFGGNGGNGNVAGRGGAQRHQGRPPQGAGGGQQRHQSQGRKRSK